jgi:multidrug efflux pump subunit AcrB
MFGAGIIGLISTPRQEDPQISVPLIDVFVEYPGASSEEVSNIVRHQCVRVFSSVPWCENGILIIIHNYAEN